VGAALSILSGDRPDSMIDSLRKIYDQSIRMSEAGEIGPLTEAFWAVTPTISQREKNSKLAVLRIQSALGGDATAKK
jgi:hypothetical protein